MLLHQSCATVRRRAGSGQAVEGIDEARRQCGLRICLRDESAFLGHAPSKDVEYPPTGRGDDALRRFAQAGAAEFPPDS